MSEAFIVGAVRTAAGKRRGKLSGWHPIDLGGKVLAELVERDLAVAVGVERVEEVPHVGVLGAHLAKQLGANLARARAQLRGRRLRLRTLARQVKPSRRRAVATDGAREM